MRRAIGLACLAAPATAAEKPLPGRNAFLAAAVAAHHLAEVIGTRSTFARAEDNQELADASTGFLLDTPESPRPSQFIVSNSSAVEIMESTALAVQSLLKDLTRAHLHAPKSAVDAENALKSSEKAKDEEEQEASSLDDPFTLALLQQDTACWVEGTWLEGGFRELVATSADACHELCTEDPACQYFSYRYKTAECALHSDIRHIEKEDGTITGPVHCNVHRRRLADESDCSVADMAIEGPRTTTVFNIPNAASCQNLCRAQSTCQYYTWTPELCSLHSSADGVIVQEGAVCGPRSCEASTTDETAVLEGASSNEVLYDADSVAVETDTSSATATTGTGGGILQQLFGLGNRSEEGVVEGASAVSSAVQAGVGAVSSITSVMAAADTVMNTIPIADMVSTGVTLANSGIFSGSGVTNRNADTAAPEGLDDPTVTCLSEGMRCCIPRLAVPNYKKTPATLNGVTSTECQTTYVSTTDQLCATTLYDDEVCGISVVETSALIIYRHIVHTPSNNMNNAICECALSKALNEDGTRTVTASATWEYSLAAADAKSEKAAQLNETVENLSTVARAGIKWLDVLSGSATGGTGGGSATGFISSILDLTDSVRQSRRRSLEEEETEGEEGEAFATVIYSFRSCSLWPAVCLEDWQAAVAASECRGLALLDGQGCPALPGLEIRREQYEGRSVYYMDLPDLETLPKGLAFAGSLENSRLVCEFATALRPTALEETNDVPCVTPAEASHVLEIPLLQELTGENLSATLGQASLPANGGIGDGAVTVALVLPMTDVSLPNSRYSVSYDLEWDETQLLAVPVSAIVAE